MRYVVLGLAVAGLAQAQNSTLIPANVTESCSTFLSSLNNNNDLSTCIQPLLNATASFSPSSNVSLTEDDINETLSSICKKQSGCSDQTIRTWLSNFYSSCQAELTGTDSYNSDVRELYDVLYVANPLKAAVCSINSANQDWCVKETAGPSANSSSSAGSGSASASASASGSTSDSASASATPSGAETNSYFKTLAKTLSPVEFAAANLYIAIPPAVGSMTKRVLNYFDARGPEDGNQAQSVMQSIIKPNSTTYRNTNLPFLFLQEDMASSQLCTPCTRDIFVSYIKWESQQPYALGLSQSPILGGQNALWRGINATCGANYVNGIVSEVGSGNFASSGIGAAASTISSIPGLGVAMALVAGGVALLF